MKFKIEFSEEKNLVLKEIREVNFDDIVDAINKGDTLDDFKHPNSKKYPKQKMLIIKIKEYVYAVPYVINQKRKSIFLKTVYPSRSLTKKYLKGKSNEK